MDVRFSIRINRKNLSKLRELDCFSSVSENERGKVICRFKRDKTLGSIEAVSGDYAVQLGSGLWQRYGAVAYDNLFKNPTEICRRGGHSSA